MLELQVISLLTALKKHIPQYQKYAEIVPLSTLVPGAEILNNTLPKNPD